MRRVVGGVAVAVMAMAATTGCGDDAQTEGEPLPRDAAVLLDAASASMGAVTSVRFHLERSGAPVFIDRFESIRLDELDGRFRAPSSVDAVMTVTIDESLSTKLGAVALDGEVWLSNPVTGTFEPLDSSYDIDPSAFFDPVEGWRPLLAELEDPVLVGEEDRGGARYHIRGVAPAERIDMITAGLVDEDLPIDFWVRRDTGLVTATEFTTTLGGETEWVIELRDYGDEFEIEPPDLAG